MKYSKLLLFTSFLCISAGTINTMTVNAAQQVTVSDSTVRNAVEAVNNLFTDNTYTTLSPNTTTETIKEARTLILKAAGKCDIVHLSNLCKKAESLLLESTNSVDSAVQNAVEAVNNLFTDNTYTTLSPNTTTETIKEARTLILKAVGKCDIVHLSNLCKKAESLLLESTNSVDSAVQNAVEAVNHLFTDNTYTTLSPNTTTETIKKARTLILKAVGKCDIVHLSNLCKKAESLLALSVHL
ncbi:hypothetical protein [Enterococcus hirae]|uniref:hypothetical protein n=1 Tax=Enterococcus hirae TaxID=1354 RepID=UPI001376A90C|nr:hypothetical protein [Enterococcus hirae]NBA55007.1 hypothetical protein [Enterococcus hirae]